jgi:hypothetical protein
MPVLAFHEPDQTAFAFAPVSAFGPEELPLRSRAGHGDCRFSAWKGRSGKRYVVSCFNIDDESALTYPDAVMVAVGPQRAVLDVRDAGPWSVAEALGRWRAEMRALGAVQLHIHLIAATADERRRVVMDLSPAH